MFCTKCGKKLPDGARFCTGCGTPVKAPDAREPIQPPVQEPAQETLAAEPTQFWGAPGEENWADLSSVAEEVPPYTPPSWTPPQAPPQKAARKGSGKKAALIIIIAAVAAALLAGGGVFGYFQYQKHQHNKAYQAALDAARDYLADGKLSQAVRSFDEALALEPESVEASIGKAEACLRSEDFREAARTLKGLELADTDENYARWQKLLGVSGLDPSISGINTDFFPTVTISVACGEGSALTRDQVRVSENGVDRDVTDFSVQNGVAEISYVTDDIAGYDSEWRDCTVTVAPEGFSFVRTQGYNTPWFEPAEVRLVSTDVSDYPTVRAYFRVESGGNAIKGLEKKSFVIWEQVQGGEYLAREIHNVSTLQDKGLNIDLVADKSDSIAGDMWKIKQVMAEFVYSLNYTKGDMAEILAFDSIVQQMCYYTNNVNLLINGINNMSTDGMTAFYDAVYKGILNASLQGGARCVIAFTDGIDNRSYHTAQEVIDCANLYQVPVYIIGVGTNYEYTLCGIADSTGGQYWYIDDLYDLQEIYNQIYDKQHEIYVVEYTSDAALDPYASRDIDVTVSGGGYKGEFAGYFKPARSVQGITHTSRYEIVKEALTWEEAAQRCQEMGGHLATITSQAEQNEIIALAEANDIKYMWLGGYTSYDSYGNVFGHWVTGEDFTFQGWSEREPSRVDQDGTEEWYIMLWNVERLGGWCWNDQRNDPAAVSPRLAEGMGFVCEYES